MKEKYEANTDDDKIELGQIIEAIHKRRWFIIISTSICLILSIIYSINLPNIYKSQVVLAPISENSGLNISGQLGSLAALAGVNIGGKGGGKTILALEVLKSKEFLGKFIEENDLYVPIMAVKGWDMKTGKMEVDPDIYDENLKEWVREVKEPFKSKPSTLETIDEFEKIIKVNQDKTTDMITINIYHYSPLLSKEIADKLVVSVNEKIRTKDLDEADKSIKYLSKKIEETSVSDMKQLLYSLIEEQTKTVMLANVRTEYVLKTIDPAVVPEKKDSPQRITIISVAVLLGFIVSVFLSFFSHINNRSKA